MLVSNTTAAKTSDGTSSGGTSSGGTSSGGTSSTSSSLPYITLGATYCSGATGSYASQIEATAVCDNSSSCSAVLNKPCGSRNFALCATSSSWTSPDTTTSGFVSGCALKKIQPSDRGLRDGTCEAGCKDKYRLGGVLTIGASLCNTGCAYFFGGKYIAVWSCKKACPRGIQGLGTSVKGTPDQPVRNKLLITFTCKYH